MAAPVVLDSPPVPAPEAPPGAPPPTPGTRSRPLRWSLQAVFIVLSLLIIVPVAWVFMASVKAKPEFYGNPWSLPKGLQVGNYADAFVDADLGRYFLNSTLVTVLALVFCMVICVPAAYVLARMEFRGRWLVDGAMMAGLFINVNYIVVPIFLMLLGWDKQLKSLLPDGFFLNNFFVLAMVYAATSIPFTVFLLTSYFRTIPAVYEEAAMLDGASRLRTMLTVILPMAKPALNTAMLFNFLVYWNDFIISLTLMTGDNRTLQVGLFNLFQDQRAAADYGRLYAGMVIVMVPVLLVYVFVQKRLLQGVGSGGDKG